MTLHTLCLGALDTNCYIVYGTDKKALIIDPADCAEKILEQIQKMNLCVEAIVLTHAHFDHMLAAEEMCAALQVPLYIGASDVEFLSDPMRNLSGVFQMCPPIALTATKLLMEDDILSIGDLSLSVLETPGHTPGSICLLGEGVLFSGDTLFRDSVGRIDFPGGNVTEMIASLQKLMSLPEDTIVYPGHGIATTIGREIQCNPYIR